MKVKAVIKEEPAGTTYNVYKKISWFGIGFWVWDFGYKPLQHANFLIEDNLKRLAELYGNDLIIEDYRK